MDTNIKSGVVINSQYLNLFRLISLAFAICEFTASLGGIDGNIKLILFIVGAVLAIVNIYVGKKANLFATLNERLNKKSRG